MHRRSVPARRPPRRGRPLLLLALLLTGGCTLLKPPATDPFGGRERSEIRIIVINNDFNDATLTARTGGERRRLGVVTGKTEATYVLPWAFTQQLQIEISILAAGSCTTPTLQVDPGEVLELQIMTEAVRGGQCSGPRGR